MMVGRRHHKPVGEPRRVAGDEGAPAGSSAWVDPRLLALRLRLLQDPPPGAHGASMTCSAPPAPVIGEASSAAAWRSVAGVTADGTRVRVAAMGISTEALAESLARAGAIRVAPTSNDC